MNADFVICVEALPSQVQEIEGLFPVPAYCNVPEYSDLEKIFENDAYIPACTKLINPLVLSSHKAPLGLEIRVGEDLLVVEKYLLDRNLFLIDYTLYSAHHVSPPNMLHYSP